MLAGQKTNAAASAGDIFRRATGLGLVLAWTDVAFFSRLVHYSTRNDIQHLNSTYAFACCGMIAAFLACALWRRFRSPKEGRRLGQLPLVAAVVLSVATCILILIEHRLFEQPWCSITSTLSGAAVAVLMLAWSERLCVPRGPSEAVASVASAFLIAAAAFVATLYLPAAAGVAVTAALPLTSYALLRATRESAPTSAERAGGGGDIARTGSAALVRTLVSIGLLSYAEAFSRALFLNVDPTSGPAYRWLFFASTVASASMLLLAASRKTRTDTVRTACRVAMCMLALLTLLTPIVEGIGLAADLTTLICYLMLNLLIWVYLTLTARAYRIDSLALFGLGLGVAFAGCLIGTFSGSVISSFFELGYRTLSLIALVCATAIVASMLFIADERVFARLVDLDDERPQAPRRFMLRIEQVARDFSLTAKETEVLVLAAKGRTTQRISEELGISAGTVNTHLAHIYKKLDVHDRQQMLDMLEGR